MTAADRRVVNSHDAKDRRGVVNKVDRRRVLSITRSRRNFLSPEFGTVSEGSAVIFGATQIGGVAQW